MQIDLRRAAYYCHIIAIFIAIEVQRDIRVLSDVTQFLLVWLAVDQPSLIHSQKPDRGGLWRSIGTHSRKPDNQLLI